jgi:hypothetical protein
MHPDDVPALCPRGFRRVPVTQGDEFYLSLHGFTANQHGFAHTHPDSEKWVVLLKARATSCLLADNPVPLQGSLVIGRATAEPHGFLSGDGPMTLRSIQLPRPSEPATTWDQPGETTDPIDCVHGGTRRRCFRCGGRTANARGRHFICENCTLEF